MHSHEQENNWQGKTLVYVLILVVMEDALAQEIYEGDILSFTVS